MRPAIVAHPCFSYDKAWLVVWCGVVSLMGLGEAVGIRFEMLLSVCQRWCLFLSVILPEPSIRTWYCLSGSTLPLYCFIPIFKVLKGWRLLLQASAYEACDCMHMPLHTPKTEMCKKACQVYLIEKKSVGAKLWNFDQKMNLFPDDEPLPDQVHYKVLNS